MGGDRYRIEVHPSYVGERWQYGVQQLVRLFWIARNGRPVYGAAPGRLAIGPSLRLFGKSGIKVSEYGILTVSAGSEAERGGHQVPGGGVQTAARL